MWIQRAGSLQGSARLADAAELEQQQPTTSVDRGEARFAKGDRVVHRQRLRVPARVDQQRGLGEPQRAIVAIAAQSFAQGRERCVPVAGPMLGESDDVIALHAGLDRERAAERGDRERRIAPAQQRRAEESVRVGALRRELAGVPIREQRLVVPTLELVAHPEQDPHVRVAGREGQGPLERLPSRPRSLRGELGAPQRDPALRILRLFLGGDPEMRGGGQRVALVERPQPHRTRRARAAREEQRPTEAAREGQISTALTHRGGPKTMLPMTRDTLIQILKRVPGARAAEQSSKSEPSYEFAESHKIAFYIGQPGRAMLVANVAKCRLDEQYVELETREEESIVFVLYDAIHAVAGRAPKKDADRRAGFA